MEVLVVFVGDVDVVDAAAFSALVSFGGKMSGVLFGTLSETLLPPHAASASAQITAAKATVTRRMRVIVPLSRLRRAGPCACRTSGSR